MPYLVFLALILEHFDGTTERLVGLGFAEIVKKYVFLVLEHVEALCVAGLGVLHRRKQANVPVSQNMTSPKANSNLGGGGLLSLSLSLSIYISFFFRNIRTSVLLLGFGVPVCRTSEHAFRTRCLILEDCMSNDVIVCVCCNEEKPWTRFRSWKSVGVFEMSDTCSVCRNRQSASQSYHKKKPSRQVVLNRTRHAKQLELGVPHYFPDIEKDMKAYCNKRTAMDRKYLRDNQDKPLNNVPSIALKQTTARERAKGWVAFYDEICEHAINLLRQTGKRPPFAQMEGSGTLQLVHGLYNTKRAAKLRERG